MAEDRLTVADQELLETARRYKSELLARMFAVSASTARAEPIGSVLPTRSNVVGVGYGAKVTAGAGFSDGPALRVYVRAKVPAVALPQAEAVPREVNGLPTDVLQVGDVTALTRPTLCGVSVGHYAVTAGTLGCLVERRGPEEDEDRYILSNNHVLANSNEGKVGDPILEPGPIDGGGPDDPIAELIDFEPIDFSGPNAMDAAIARLLDRDDVEPEILDIGRVQQPAILAALYQSVCKRGRTTLHTVGVVMGLAADINVAIGTCGYPTLVMVNRYPPPGYTHSPEPVLPSSPNVPLAYAGEPFSPAQIVRVSPSSS